jgi:signal transduction histidine kinase
VAVSDAQGELHAILVIFKDISMIKDIERVKDEFLSSVTHELRSPLASIKGFAETLQRDPEMPAATRSEFMSIICEESSRLQKLIEELLDLRRLQSRGLALRVAPYDLKLLADDVVRGAHSISLAKNIKIQIAWEGEDQAKLRGDVAQMGRALRNLLVNAVKYSPPGGTIVLRGQTKGKRISLEVGDQGTGISEKDLPYIFDQFYRGASKGRQRGTGLGLAIVKHIVEMHGGRLGVRSEVGAGTIFRIELPREAPVAAEGPAAGEPAAVTPAPVETAVP